MDTHPDTQWIDERLAVTAPPWEPDVIRARAALEAAPKRSRRRAGAFVLAAATAVVIAAIVAPAGRTLAHDLWYRFYASRIAVVRLDLSRNPLETSIRSNDKGASADSIEQAAAIAGFTPYLPSVGDLPEPPVLTVMGRIEMTQTIRVQRLSAALSAAGATDLEVPAEWEGVRLRAEIGPIVSAKYLDRSRGATSDVEIMQMPAVRLEMPAGFPLARLAEIVFRAGGAPALDARRLGEEYADNPAWLFDLPAEAPVTVEEIALPRGNGLLIQYLDDDDDPGSTRSLVLLGRPWRLYGVIGPDRDQAVRLAAALP